MAATHMALGHAFSFAAAPGIGSSLDELFSSLRSLDVAGGSGVTHAIASHHELDELVSELSTAAIHSRPESLRLHAGVVGRGGRAVLVVGGAGAGKTTFTVAAIEAGWDYLSDEVASVEAEQLTVEAYPKPLTVRPGAQAVLPHLAPRGFVASGASWHVNPESIRPGSALPPGAVRAVAGIVLISFQPDAELVVTEPTRGQIVLELAQQTAYLGLLDQPLDVLLELADRVPVRRVVHSDARRAVSVLDSLIR